MSFTTIKRAKKELKMLQKKGQLRGRDVVRQRRLQGLIQKQPLPQENETNYDYKHQ